MHHAFTANIDAIAAFDVASHFTHDHNFAGNDVGLHGAVAADGDAVVQQLILPSMRPSI